MRSIFSKVMLWCLGTFALSLVAFWAISRTLDRRGPPRGDPFPHFLAMVEDDLCRAYEKGGPRAARRSVAPARRLIFQASTS